jgi:hypothetical protein
MGAKRPICFIAAPSLLTLTAIGVRFEARVMT